MVSNNSLVFNDKTKLMLFSTTQLSQIDNLNINELFKVMHKGEATERVNKKRFWEFILMKTYPSRIM